MKMLRLSLFFLLQTALAQKRGVRGTRARNNVVQQFEKNYGKLDRNDKVLLEEDAFFRALVVEETSMLTPVPSSAPTRSDELVSTPSAEPTDTAPSAAPSKSPSSTPTQSECTGSVSSFSTSVFLDLNGPIDMASPDDIDLLEDVLKDAYNEVAGCDQPGAFIEVQSVEVVTSSDVTVGSGSRPFTMQVLFEGECRGCKSDPVLFSEDSSSTPPGDGTCACDFPTVDAYVLECNKRLAELSLGGGSFVLERVTLLVTGAGVGEGTPSEFSGSVLLGGTGRVFGASSSELLLLGEAFVSTYNAMNAFNYQVCDKESRVITTVVPTIQEASEDVSSPSPFSIVFNIVGTCRGCGQAAVLFGNHRNGRRLQDLATLCPVGAEFRCPSEEEFLAALANTIDRLRSEGELTIIDSLSDVQQVDTGTPSPAPTRCIPSPTTGPMQPLPVDENVDLSAWATADSNGNWVIADDNLSVLQTVNGNPTFFCSDFSAFDNDLSGTIRVETSFDNDFVGFTLGYELGDFDNPDADYLLIDWKRGNQNVGGDCAAAFAQSGLAVTQVRGTPSYSEFWGHLDLDGCLREGTVEELARGTALSSTGWSAFVDYNFRFVYTGSRLQVFVNDILEVDITGSYSDGSFCFYNLSQSNVRYSGFTRTVLTDPPAVRETCPPDTTPSPAPMAVPTKSPLLPPGPTIVNNCIGSVALSWGDPHLVTFDSLKYDCQGEGEFVLLRTVNALFEVQARFAASPLGPVSTTTAIAISEESLTPVIQLAFPDTPSAETETVGGCPLDLYVNGVKRRVSSGSGSNDAIKISVSSDQVTLAYGSSGAVVTAVVSSSSSFGCYFNTYVCLPDTNPSLSTVVGLMGTPNQDTSDDWMNQTDTLEGPLTLADSLFETAYEYCTTNWCIRDESVSLFSYEAGFTFASFENCDAPYPGSVDTGGASPELVAICGDDISCLTDGILGGLEDAENAVKALEDLESARSPIVETCSFEVNSNPLSWTEHQAAAKARDCNLASILNQEEDNAVFQIIRNNPSVATFEFIWVGGKLRNNGTLAQRGASNWEWSDGSLWSYENWLAGEPNNYQGQNENRLTIRSAVGWNDGNEVALLPAVYKCCSESKTSAPSDAPTPTPSSSPTREAIILYENDFESPNRDVTITCGTNIDGTSVNINYGGSQGNFTQANTVETVVIDAKWTSDISYDDPDGTAGKYAIGMLRINFGDMLALGYNTGGKTFINVAMDVSSIDVNGCGGPFGIADPIFRVSLIDDPTGSIPLGGTVLDSADMTGPAGPNQWTFRWTRNTVSLNATGSTNGNVAVVWALIQSGYAAFDNLVVEASDFAA